MQFLAELWQWIQVDSICAQQEHVILQSFPLKLYLGFTVPGQQAVMKSPSMGKKDNSVLKHTSRMDFIVSVSTLKEVWGNLYK